MKNNLFFLLLFTVSFFSSHAQAQCRPATADENQAYNQVVAELQRQFKAKMPAGNWRIFHENHSMGKLQVTDEYVSPLHLCTDRYDLVMEKIEVNTARTLKLDSLKADSTQQSAFIIARDSLYRENPNRAAPSNLSYTINVEMNLANYRLQEAESARTVETYKAVNLAGTQTALEVLLKPEFKGVAGRQETVVLLGTWGKAQTEANGDIRYRYGFKKGGKLIESLVVTITAPFEIAQQITQQIDWQAIKNTLLK